MRVISSGPSPRVWRRSRLLTITEPAVTRARATPAAPNSRGSWSATRSFTLSTVIPTETSPITVPSVSNTGTIVSTARPTPGVVDVAWYVSPASASAYDPATRSPIRSGSGWVQRMPEVSKAMT